MRFYGSGGYGRSGARGLWDRDADTPPNPTRGGGLLCSVRTDGGARVGGIPNGCLELRRRHPLSKEIRRHLGVSDMLEDNVSGGDTGCLRAAYRRRKCFDRLGQLTPEPTFWLARLSVVSRVGPEGGVPKARKISRA